jgi:hypothetical protein
LEPARGDQRLDARGDGAARRCDAETGRAQDEQTPLAEDISERAADQDQRAQRQQIRVDDPLLALEATAQVAADRR